MMTDMDAEEDDLVLEEMMGGGDFDGGDADDLDSSLAEAMAEASALLDTEDSSTVQTTRAIQSMVDTQLFVHPQHSHSFSKVTFTLGKSLRKCAGCEQGFKSSVSGVFSSSNNNGAKEPADPSIVKCMACGAFAHRSCALSSTIQWNEVCPINGPSVQKTAVVVTDDEAEKEEDTAIQEGEEEEEVTEYEVDLETKLSDNINDDKTNTDDIDEDNRKIPDRSRNNSRVSRASNSDESMDTQELEEEEDEDQLLDTADETNLTQDVDEEDKSQEAAEDEAQADSQPPQTHSPYQVARRAISSLPFKKRKDGTPSLSDNPYAGDDDENHDHVGGEEPSEKSLHTAEGGGDKLNEDESPDAAAAPSPKARKWFAKSPLKDKVVRRAKHSEEEGGTDSTPDTPRKKWFGGKKSNNNITKEEVVSTMQDKEEMMIFQQENSSNNESVNEEVPPTPVMPWSSSHSRIVVEEDYGEAVEEMSQASQAQADESFHEGDPDENNDPDSHVGARRGWFQRKNATPAEGETDEASENTSTAAAPSRFSLFSKKRGQKENVASDAKKPSTSDSTEDVAEEPNVVEVEFSNFLDVDDAENEEKEEGPVTSDRASVPKDDDKEEEDEKEDTSESKMGLASPDEKRARVGFGLFRRKTSAGAPEEEANNDDFAPATESSPDQQHANVSTRSVGQEEENLEKDEKISSIAGEAVPASPATPSKTRFRLFARKGGDEIADVQPTETVSPADQSEMPPKSPLSIKSIWEKNTNTGDDQADDAIEGEKGNNSSSEIEEFQEHSDGNDNQGRPSLLSRVFTSAKGKKNEDDGNLIDETSEEPTSANETPQALDEDVSNQGRASLLSRVFTSSKSKNNEDGDNLIDDASEEPSSADGTPQEPSSSRFLRFSSRKAADTAEQDAHENIETEKPSPRKFSLFGFGRRGKEAETGESNVDAGQSDSWASEGPPSHWTTATTATYQNSNIISEECQSDETDEAGAEKAPLHYANHPFASVSKALQDNILALHNKGQGDNLPPNDDKDKEEGSESASTLRHPLSSLSLIVSPDSSEPEESNDAALGEIKPEPVQESTLSKVASGTYEVASGTYEIVKATAKAQKNMGVATVAGGIAGGVAGLMFAGPAGAVMGVRYGQTAGALGVILEGSLTVGVVVAGVAGGRFTAEKIQEQIEEQRVLTIGENGVARKVMLVRPTICIDPAWHDICTEAQRTAPSSSSSVISLFSTTDTLKQQRYERTSDIIEEDEIPTDEKVLLLVSRVLSDKNSFPGHVYRCLMQAFKDRCDQRKELTVELAKNKEDYPHLFDANDGGSEDSVKMGDGVNLTLSPRARREDAHGVIKYITATLLEVRPGLASTPEITETTASVVEALVFGEVFDLVYEEIAIEATEKDKRLLERIDDFEFARHQRTGMPLPTDGIVSKQAIAALKKLPQMHAAADKLRHCVEFLEELSSHFAEVSSKSSAMGADSLLKMVCQHIIAAKMPCVNAEVAFLEEFARDEQLLRGKEGYALVTLQASLHFLNMSNDFERDIFGQDNDEENVPIVESRSDDAAANDNEQNDLTNNTHDEKDASGDVEDHPEHLSSASSDEKSVAEIEAKEEKKEEPDPMADEDML